jgi:hypothetical protein
MSITPLQAGDTVTLEGEYFWQTIVAIGDTSMRIVGPYERDDGTYLEVHPRFVALDAVKVVTEDEQKSELYNTICDISKDLNGWRVRFDWKAMSLEQLTAIRHVYQRRLEAFIAEQKESEK